MANHRPKLGISVADLFCGAGGISEGFAAAGYDVVYGVDAAEDAVETFHANHPWAQHEQADLAKLDKGAFRERLRGVDVVVGGPCCQGFSTGGRGRKADWTKKNRLWSRMLLAVETARPAAFLLENVPGLVQHGDGSLRGRIVNAFEDLGYQITTSILLAADYGVPQLRRRVFVVGLRGRRGDPFEWPDSPYLGGWRRDTQEFWEKRRREQGKHRHLTVQDAIGDLPVIRAGSAGTSECPYDGRRPVSAYAKIMRAGSDSVLDHEVKVLTASHRELMSHVPPGGTWRDIPPPLRPGRFAGGMAPSDSTNLLARLHPRRPAYTITTKFDNVTCGCFTHPTQDRGLSVREAARFQSFPDRYVFHGTLAAKRTLVGNAVPPLLAQHLGCGIAERVGKKEPRRPQVVVSVFDEGMGAPTEQTRRRMRVQPRKATKPEVLLGTELKRLGVAFKTNVLPEPTLRREIDILIESANLAVFVDGCFWHGCPIHTRATKSNTKWWRKKIDANRQRDAKTNALLEERGFRVLRIWEHEYPDVAAAKIVARLAETTSTSPRSASNAPVPSGEGSSPQTQTHARSEGERGVGRESGLPRPYRVRASSSRERLAAP